MKIVPGGRRLSRVTLALAAALAWTAAPAQAPKTYQLKFNHVLGPKEPYHAGFQNWAKRVGQRTKGGIAEQESPINVSNVVLVCPTCGVAKVGFKTEGSTKVRICKKCGSELPTKK